MAQRFSVEGRQLGGPVQMSAHGVGQHKLDDTQFHSTFSRCGALALKLNQWSPVLILVRTEKLAIHRCWLVVGTQLLSYL